MNPTLETTHTIRGRSRALPGGSPSAVHLVFNKKKGAHGGNMVSPVLSLADELEFGGID